MVYPGGSVPGGTYPVGGVTRPQTTGTGTQVAPGIQLTYPPGAQYPGGSGTQPGLQVPGGVVPGTQIPGGRPGVQIGQPGTQVSTDGRPTTTFIYPGGIQPNGQIPGGAVPGTQVPVYPGTQVPISGTGQPGSPPTGVQPGVQITGQPQYPGGYPGIQVTPGQQPGGRPGIQVTGGQPTYSGGTYPVGTTQTGGAYPGTSPTIQTGGPGIKYIALKIIIFCTKVFELFCGSVICYSI